MEGSGSFLSGKKSNSASTIRVILISYFPSFSKKIAMPILVGMAILFLIFSLIICELMDARPAEQSLRVVVSSSFIQSANALSLENFL